MRSLPLFLMIACGQSFAQSPQPSASEQRITAAAPLTPAEGRLILGQLHELRALRAEADALREYVARDAEQDRRERENSDRALELERRAADLERDKAATYEQLYRALAAKPGWGCRLWRAVTLGLGRCNNLLSLEKISRREAHQQPDDNGYGQRLQRRQVVSGKPSPIWWGGKVNHVDDDDGSGG